MPKSVAKSKFSQREELLKEPIVIDESKGLVFQSEDELYDHFLPQIQALEKEFFLARSKNDILEEDFDQFEELLNHVLDDPDEIWEDVPTIFGIKIRTYLGHYTAGEHAVFYVALTYCTDNVPSFVFLHFPSTDLDLVDRFRRSQLIYDRVLKEVEQGAVEGDALGEGDDLAVGLYRAMLTLRSETDIQEPDFKNYEQLREKTIEEPDEIWRSNDLDGNILVTFIRQFAKPGDGAEIGSKFNIELAKDNEADEAEVDTADDAEASEATGHELHYIVVTIEDTPSSSHALLFSFPTMDDILVGRYRHGENLQAEEVVQEASH
jgi:hypothetical protein